MKSQWSDREADAYIARYAEENGEDLALRLYTTHLIGRDPDLVLHGGGNTSLKTTVADVYGEPLEVLRIKGSGHDLGSIEPDGYPALELAPLQRLERLDELHDEHLMNQLCIRRLDSSAPNPSLESLMHALLPQRFVDHSHADAILVLSNQPDGAELMREALGEEIPIIPWTVPGLPLAKAVGEMQRRHPECPGMILLHHGLVTFADEARASYERMIELVERAESFIASRTGSGPPMLASTSANPAAARREMLAVAPIIRGALALRAGEPARVVRRFVAEWRCDADLLAFAAHPDAPRLVCTPPLTPDHVIRTKGDYLYLQPEQARDGEACRAAIAGYARRYGEYYKRNRARLSSPQRGMVDPHPRVVVVPGLGILAFGEDARAARIAADIAEHNLRAKARGAALGRYSGLDEGELFDMEYWCLEQAKLAPHARPLVGRIALVTGAAGAIGHGIAEALLDAGAQVLLSDRDTAGLDRVRELLAKRHRDRDFAIHAADVTAPDQVAELVGECVLRYGGLDVLVPNAGIAHVSTIADMDPERFSQVLDVNLNGTLYAIQSAARVFASQETGGAVIVQSSKNVFDPGAGFGAYSASKAGAHQLGKIAALELAPLGVRVNMINADAVFGDQVPSGLWAAVGPDRMKARGLDPQGLRDYYRERSLLKVPVTPADIGRAVVFFATEATPTTGATLPVDSGVAAAFPR